MRGTEGTPGCKGRPFPTEKGFRHTKSQACRSEKHISSHQYQSSSCNGLTGSCNVLAGKETVQARTQRSAVPGGGARAEQQQQDAHLLQMCPAPGWPAGTLGVLYCWLVKARFFLWLVKLCTTTVMSGAR